MKKNYNIFLSGYGYRQNSILFFIKLKKKLLYYKIYTDSILNTN